MIPGLNPGPRRGLLSSGTSGSQMFTSNGTFNVPANFDSLTVTVRGKKGADGSGVAAPIIGFCPGAAGGLGGQAVKTYTPATLTPGSTVAVVFSNTGGNNGYGYSQFGTVQANNGGPGGDGGWQYINGDGEVACSFAFPGGSGTASGGDTNSAGVLSLTAGDVIISWTASGTY